MKFSALRIAVITAIMGVGVAGHAANSTNFYNLGFGAPSISGVSNIPNPEVGAIVLDQNTGSFAGYNGTSWTTLSGGNAPLAPTIQRLTGSGTYSLPTSPTPLYIRVRMVGGGGGSAGNATGFGAGGAGGTTSFGTSLLIANGGSGSSTTNAGGAGGTASIAYSSTVNGTALSGGNGHGSSPIVYSAGGAGGTNPLGGAGSGTPGLGGAGGAGVALTGAGGGGAGGLAASGGSGGGGAGGYVDAIISSPSGSYSFAVGAGGTAGTTVSGSAGAAGGSGSIEVTEYYQ